MKEPSPDSQPAERIDGWQDGSPLSLPPIRRIAGDRRRLESSGGLSPLMPASTQLWIGVGDVREEVVAGQVFDRIDSRQVGLPVDRSGCPGCSA